MILRSPTFLLLLLLLPAFALVGLRSRHRLRPAVLALRLSSVGLLILALADPALRSPVELRGALVLLVDQSDSLGEPGKQALRQQAQTLADTYQADLRVIAFGADTVAGPLASSGQPAQLQRTDQTDLAGALRVARSVAGEGGRVLLLSDGLQTRGDALAEAEALAQAGIPVDTFSYQPPEAPEIWLERMVVPRTLRQGEDYQVELFVQSTGEASAQLELSEGQQLLEAQRVTLKSGANRITWDARAVSPGVLRLRAQINGQPDSILVNNSAAAFALVAPPPSILIVEARKASSQTLRTVLGREGIMAEAIEASRLPSQISPLLAYDGIVLLDVPAGALSLDQQSTLREFVRSEGRGLVVIGGRSSFTLGAYRDTPLEQALPVLMTPRPRPQRPEVAMLLIIDRSASMGSVVPPSKFDMAKESAILTVESLREEDRLGVLTFDTEVQWSIPFQQLGTGLSVSELTDQISLLETGGGTNIYEALKAGLPELARQSADVRHAILLTDGRASTVDDLYMQVIEQARDANITLSAVALGQDADAKLLQNLATWGGGRYHFAAAPDDIPRLTLLESEIAQTEPQLEGRFRAELASPHPLLRGYAASDLPGLDGYVATSIKPEAELVLQSPEGDPLLAVWQYGLGRAVAWTSGVDDPWAADWRAWAAYGSFWAQQIRYTLPEPDSGLLQARVTPSGEAVAITVDALGPSGEPVDLADVEVLVRLPDASTRQLELTQVEPGRYRQELLLPSTGAYAFEVTERKSGRAEVRTIQTGYIQPYSAEYLPREGGPELLSAISALTGGNALDEPGALASTYAPPGGERGLWPWLLLLAALLWPVEIALRRGLLRLPRRNSP